MKSSMYFVTILILISGCTKVCSVKNYSNKDVNLLCNKPSFSLTIDDSEFTLFYSDITVSDVYVDTLTSKGKVYGIDCYYEKTMNLNNTLSCHVANKSEIIADLVIAY